MTPMKKKKKTQKIMERFLTNDAKCADGEQDDQVPSVRVGEMSGVNDKYEG